MDPDEKKTASAVDVGSTDVASGDLESTRESGSQLQRKLGAKEVQLFAVGGAIGTSVFLTMGTYLPNGGPAGLLIAYGLWSLNVCCVNESFAEMTVYAPVASPFIQFTAQWVDPALAFAQSWAFFLTQVLLLPSEITAFYILLTYWTDKVPVEAMIILILALYAVLNAFSVRWFGRAEFYLSIGKVFLVILCFFFTFFTMVGCNPLHDAYGFRYWQNPGPFAEYLTTGALGGFWGTLSCMTFASFAICGPEYAASVAAEARTPRTTMPPCFRSFKWRLALFFFGSALCVGIVIPYNDPSLLAFIAGTSAGSGTTAAVPYTIAMNRMKIPGLPHVLNAVMMTSVFSCGNGVLYAASRALFAMGRDGRAPAIFARTTRHGIPIYAVALCLAVGLLAMMRVDAGSYTILKYFIDLCTVCGQFNYLCVCVTYLHFYYNLKAQGVSRDTLPYRSRWQPGAAYVGAVCSVLAMLFLGFDVLHPFEIKWFFLDYTLVAIFPIAALAWKFIHRTKYIRIGAADLGLAGQVKEVDDYEESTEVQPENWVDKFWGGGWEWRDLGNAVLRKRKT